MTGSVSVETPLGYVKRGTFRPGQTIAAIYREQGLSLSVPVICVRNGKPLLRERRRGNRVIDHRRWELTRARARDRIEFVCVLQGGDSSKNILRTVALIALAITASAIVGPSGLALSGWVAASVQAGIVLGGAFLLSVLLPVKGASADASTASAQAASPTYTLDAQGNQARLLQPIPRLYGRHRIFPDFGAQPYTRFVGNQQFLYQFFVLGVGEYSVEEVRLGDTAIWKNGAPTNVFPGLQIDFYEPAEQVTLINTGCDVSPDVSGQELRQFSIGDLTLGANVVTIVADGPSGNTLQGFRSGDQIIIAGAGANDGTYTVQSYDSPSQLTVTTSFPSAGFFPGSTASLVNSVGPYLTGRAGRPSTVIEVDFVFPNGLAFIAQDTTELTTYNITVDVYGTPVDDFGNPTGPQIALGSHTYTDNTRTAKRVTEIYAGLALSRWSVIVVRFNSNLISTTDTALDTMLWTGMRSFYPEDQVYPNVSSMAILLAAGAEISAAGTRTVNVIETAKLPVRFGGVWLPAQITQNPAWAMADILRNTTYGLGLPDSRLDLDRLEVLAGTWDPRGDQFNGIFDTTRTAWDALKEVAVVGRAQPIIVGNIISFYRETESTVARGVFTPRNIRAGTLEFTHVMVDDSTPDDVIVEFINQDTWKPDEVQCTMPGSSSVNPVRVSRFGITSRSQALREGFFLAASNKYRRILASFATELEGKLLIKGDTILISHDVIKWGQSGEIESFVDATNLVTFSDTINWLGLTTLQMVLNIGNNRQWGPVTVTKPEDSDFKGIISAASRVVVESTMGPLVDVMRPNDSFQNATRYALGDGTTYAKRCKVVSIQPQDMNTLQVVAQVDDPRVYISYG